MTKTKFIRIQTARGYRVEDHGKMVVLSLNNYRAYWFFNADGTTDEGNPPFWKVDRK